VLVKEPGYDSVSQRYAASTRAISTFRGHSEAARAALAMMQELIAEFHFVAPHIRLRHWRRC